MSATTTDTLSDLRVLSALARPFVADGESLEGSDETCFNSSRL
jgi:hypothetical protein